MQKIKLTLNTIERLGFFLLALVGLLSLVKGNYFPTLDGPAHLYNSHLIQVLLFQENTVVHDFVEFNLELVPNWTGHFLLAILNTFFSSSWAEKLFLGIYLISLPYSFRYFVHVISPKNSPLSFLIFPFVFTTFFYFGFYNFNISLIFLFLTLGFWFKHKSIGWSRRKILILFLLITLTYFSHVFIFGLLLVVFTVFYFIELIEVLFLKKEGLLGFKLFLKRIVPIALAVALPFVMFLSYYFSRGAPEFNQYLSQEELWKKVFSLDLFTGLSKLNDDFYGKTVFVVIALSVTSILVFRIFSSLKNHSTTWIKQTDLWLILSVLFGYLYFVSPSENEFGGLIIQRIEMIFYLLFVIWLICQPLAKYVTWMIVLGVSIFHLNQMKKNREEIFLLQESTNEYLIVAEKIKPNSIVFPINYSPNWLNLHSSNYFFHKKGSIILDNYECNNDYFPLRWKKKNLPDPTIQGKSLNDFYGSNWVQKGTSPRAVDYVLVFGTRPADLSPDFQELHQLISEGYKNIYQSNQIGLFERIE